jgi:uncharacterized protein YecT (DUF1311 family)
MKCIKYSMLKLIPSIVFIFLASACSAKSSGLSKVLDQNQKNAKEQAIADTSDCFSVGAWAEREACFSKMSDDQIASCELTNPGACKPYKAMYFATKKISQLESEINKNSSKIYKNYLENDPNYIKDLHAFLKDAGKSWAMYRDSQCQLEPYISGMSRNEFSGLVQQCRLEKTEIRILELEALIKSLK